MRNPPAKTSVAIACGGTGGHLFPGRAVAEALLTRGCEVTLLISSKDVDQQAAHSTMGVEVVTLPAVGLAWRRLPGFLRSSFQSYCLVRQLFQERPPQAVLAMGGFTGAPVVLAGKRAGATTFLHESNATPGRANRWLAPFVDQAFLGFPQASRRLPARSLEVTGTPVRSCFQPSCSVAARRSFGLDPAGPVLLVMGGSQGAGALNDLLLRSLLLLGQAIPALQFLHLTGPKDFPQVTEAYRAAGLRAVTYPFLAEMPRAMAAATLAVSRAGASSLAELAAMRLPSILIPFPFAADDHQFHNARAFVESGAALLLPQPGATPPLFAQMVQDLVDQPDRLQAMKRALAQWHKPGVAACLADRIVNRIVNGELGLEPASPEAKACCTSRSDGEERFEPGPLGLDRPSVVGALSPSPPSARACKLKP